MKKLIIFILLLSSTLHAVDTKVTALDELTAILGTDILYVVDDPGGTPLSKKITATNLFDIIDTFAELNTIVADKTLVNEEDAVAWDALVTCNLGLTITTGDPFTLGANRIDNGSDLLDGEQIAADTIDNDSIDWGDMTDLTTDGALDADVVDEAHIADDGINSEHYNDGSIDLVHLAAGVYAKDLVTTAPITGAADNIFVGADSDVTVAITMLKDIVTTAPLTGAENDVLPGADADLTLAITLLKDVVATSPILIDGGANVDDILPGSDADLTISIDVLKDLVTTAPLTGGTNDIFPGSDADITVAIPVAATDANGYLSQTDWNTFNGKMASTLLKDLVTTAPVTGGTNDIFPGADADITVALDFTAAWDFGGATSIEIVNATDPDVDAAGEISHDTDGANETADESLRGYDGAAQFAWARKLKTLNFTLISPDTIDAADLIPIWHNTSGMTFTIVEWKAWSDDDDVSLEIEELTDQTDYTAITTVDAVEIATDGTGVYYASDATITHAAIEHDHSIAIDFDVTDTPDYVQIAITGWFNSDVD